MKKLIIAAVALSVLGACKKTAENEYEVERPGLVTDTVRLPDADIGTTTDTINTPVFGTKKDTVVFDRPTRKGSKQVEVKRPTTDPTYP